MAKYLIVILILSTNLFAQNNTTDTIKLTHKINLSIVGDFDGDGRKDTLKEHLISLVSNKEIDSLPDIYQNNLEEIEEWSNKNNTKLCLIFKKDTLLVTDNIADAYGLYCLINIGDLNKDGKDEIAFVVNYLDFSSSNSCKIYTFCKGNWFLLKRFNIYEDEFESKKENRKNGFLEKRKQKWYFKDLDDEKLKILRIDKCN